MAKTAWINRNERKRATAKSPTRVVNRCEVTGRRRAFIRRFKMSRLTFRELASQGLIPGVTKSSW